MRRVTIQQIDQMVLKGRPDLKTVHFAHLHWTSYAYRYPQGYNGLCFCFHNGAKLYVENAGVRFKTRYYISDYQSHECEVLRLFEEIGAKPGAIKGTKAGAS